MSLIVIVAALHEIRHEQKVSGDGGCIAFAPFSRLVREIAQGVSKNKDWRFQRSAVGALLDATEYMLISLFEGMMNDPITATITIILIGE